MPCVVVTPEIGVSTPKAFAEWDRMQGLMALSQEASDAALKRRSSTARPRNTATPQKLTVTKASDRMNELGRELSAWLSELYSSAPSGFMARRGRAGNPLLALVQAGIQNDFEQVVFPEYPELDEANSALVCAGAKYASLSGSGSTIFGLFGSREAARSAVSRLRKGGWAAQATSTLTRAAYWRRVFGA